MKNRKKPQNYWQHQADSFANYYKDITRFSLKNYVTAFLDARTNILMSLMDCKKDSVVLDVGCGSGVHIKLFAPRCKEIVGIDSSKQMLEAAEKELKKLEKHNWRLKLADAQRLPFPDRSFDWVISLGVLDYVPSPQQTISECWRVLREPGFIIFSIPKKPSLFFFLRTSIGNLIKKKVFGLPPISNALTRAELDMLLRLSRFNPNYIKPLWTTMWIVRATKKRF